MNSIVAYVKQAVTKVWQKFLAALHAKESQVRAEVKAKAQSELDKL